MSLRPTLAIWDPVFAFVHQILPLLWIKGKKSMNQHSDESLDLVVQEIMMIRECSALNGLDCKRLLACEAVGHGDR